MSLWGIIHYVASTTRGEKDERGEVRSEREEEREEK
jgi:hypothetical protein